jgi:hypothetical protein
MVAQRAIASPRRSSVAAAAFYGASAFIASLALAILITSASLAYAIAPSFQ